MRDFAFVALASVVGHSVFLMGWGTIKWAAAQLAERKLRRALAAAEELKKQKAREMIAHGSAVAGGRAPQRVQVKR